MARVLLTGGTGFIAAHILQILLEHGHSVVTTVRSQKKADSIKEAYPNTPKSKLDFAIVEDIAQEGAFDNAVKSDPPIEVIIHTASPFNLKVEDIKKDVLEPAIRGTTNILKAAQTYAPTVRRIIITSSFVAMLDVLKGNWPEKTYTKDDWCPLTEEQALSNPIFGYMASKKMAEEAAWEFVKQKTNFTITTICPPIVYGPVIHPMSSLKFLNTSNQRVLDIMTGGWKTQIPDNDAPVWVDVRDLALGHVKAIEAEGAANERFFVVAGHCSNRQILEIVRQNFPNLAENLPAQGVPGGEFPEGGIYGYDNQEAVNVLGLEFRSLEDCITDTVKSLQNFKASA